jgi:outer membrane protein TolC
VKKPEARSRNAEAATILITMLWAAPAWAQLPGQNTGTQTPTANQLPLSGRSGQSGSVNAVQSPVPGTTTSVNTLNTSVQTQGPFSGSASGAARPFSGKLSFKEAIERGLRFNLGQVGLEQGVRQARGLSRVARSALLPNLNSSLSETVEQTNLRALGVRFNSPIPGFNIPAIVGPFNYFDLRARLAQTVADVTELDNYRSAKESVRANEQSARDARDLVVLGVGGAYLQVLAAQARVRTERAQVETAQALFDQASQQRAAGVLALTDLNRAEVQLLTERQRLVSLENDLAKQKINLARLTGLPATDAFEVTDDVPYTPAPAVNEPAALQDAYARRADLRAAEAEVRAARLTHAAARAERLPSLSLSADYGAIGTNPNQAHGTFSVVGTLSVPIWQGGRTEGDIEQADAALAQRNAELEDTRSRVEADVRNAFLDLRAASAQVEVAARNIVVSKQNLDLTRQRFTAGVTDNVEVVQAQESVASAELDYIDSVFAHNVAKLSLARAVGGAEENLGKYLGLR